MPNFPLKLNKSVLLQIAAFCGEFIALAERLGAYVRLCAQTLTALILRPPPWGLLREHLYDMGVGSLPVVAVTGLSTGMVLATQSFMQLSDKGLASATGILVVKAMLSELGPILTAFMITGRVGAAMCAQLGSMQVTEQIDAMRSMAVDPIEYLLVPRFLATLIATPVLTIFSNFMGIFGGYLIATTLFGMPSNNYLDPLPQNVTAFDLTTGLIKAVVFGFFMVSICCYKGLTAKGGAAGVGKATTQSVVACYSCFLIFNFVMTIGFNLILVWIYS